MADIHDLLLNQNVDEIHKKKMDVESSLIVYEAEGDNLDLDIHENTMHLVDKQK
jgi:hypothetical protein